MPNASSSQATRLANRLFVVAEYLVSRSWIFPRREPYAHACSLRPVSLDPIQDIHFITIKSIADPGQAAPVTTEIFRGVILILHLPGAKGERNERR